ncbi:transporter substrate-binding domain-containing protein [Stutzerimonas stutzeri]|uniref:Transporter substrate-binding domain-containing protein n=1 Tax=Stutzerimonas stutzeri TaxID=316 RepID=A0A6I6M1V6_STUST|nr:transporter substrate-binding domain-containing protein [Stutzerimonas stutzeri]
MPLATVLASPCLCASAAEPPRTLTVGYYDFPPAIYSDTQGRPQGPLVDLTRELLETAGYQARFRGLPSARLYAALKNGTVDLWPGAPGKPELIADTIEGRETLAQISLNLYHRPDTPPPQVPSSLARRGVIVIGGYNYWPAVNQMLHDPQLGIRLHRASSHASAIEMLQHRRGDYLLDYQIPVNQVLQRLGQRTLPYVNVYKVPIRFIVSRRLDDSQRVIDALDRAYVQRLEAGEDMSLPGE